MRAQAKLVPIAHHAIRDERDADRRREATIRCSAGAAIRFVLAPRLLRFHVGTTRALALIRGTDLVVCMPPSFHTERDPIMTAKRIHAAFAVLGLSLLSLPASAQEQPGYASNHFNPSERGSQWFVLDSLDMRGNGRLALGLVNDYSYRSLVDYAHDGSVNQSIVRNQYLAHLGGSVVLGDRFRIGLSVPLQLFADGHTVAVNGVVHRPSEDVAAGDVRIGTDVRILGSYGDAATLAGGVQLFLPSGSQTAYTGDGKPRVHPHLLFAGRASALTYAANLGFMYRVRDEEFGDGKIGSQLTFGASAGVRVADDKLVIGPEIYGSTVTARAFENRTTPLEVLLGAHYDLGANLRGGLGLGTLLTRGYGAPVARALLSIEWVPGNAKEDAPPPPPDDRDGDGITDCADACGFVKGVKSDDPSKNGCPLPNDTDGDGVTDDVDACPRAVGPASPDPAKNGCPPATVGDQDGDGVPDVDDACPGTAGVRTADAKTNGCPDQDRDHDGVPNDVDACPDEAGKPDPDPKKNGCPKAFLQGGTIKIVDQVRFKNASAEIVPGPDSEGVLQAVVTVLKAHPEVKKVRVEGHTDDKGLPASNKTLSQARAASVVKWLTEHGIAADRLDAVGYGDERPLEPNKDDESRSKNRRVEFHVEQAGSGQ